MNNIKQEILDDIRNKSRIFKKVSSIRYRIRCPLCGDSQKNLEDTHCYIKCSPDPTEPLFYICFLCNESGIVNKRFLSKIGVKDDLINQLFNQKYNVIKYSGSSIANPNILTGDPILGSPQMRYIEHRLGEGFTLEDYDKFKIIWDMNLLYQHITNQRVRNTLPSINDSITFLSDDKSTLLTRSFNDNGDRWRKISMFKSDNKSFYTIKTTLDLFTSEQIYVNFGEGIFDVLSAYKNFNDGPNSIFIALLGSDYISGIDYIIQKGILGYNVNIKIYIDDNIDEDSLKKKLKKYKYLFNRITICKNIKSKDIGVRLEKINLVESNV